MCYVYRGDPVDSGAGNRRVRADTRSVDDGGCCGRSAHLYVRTDFATDVRPVWLTKGDINGNGEVDRVISYYEGGQIRPMISTMLGFGDGTFARRQDFDLAPDQSGGGIHGLAIMAVLADFNGDGFYRSVEM